MSLPCLAMTPRHPAVARNFLVSRCICAVHGVNIRTRSGNEQLRSEQRATACSAEQREDSAEPQKHNSVWQNVLQSWNRLRLSFCRALAVAIVACAMLLVRNATTSVHPAMVPHAASMTVQSSPSEQAQRWALYKMQRVCYTSSSTSTCTYLKIAYAKTAILHSSYPTHLYILYLSWLMCLD